MAISVHGLHFEQCNSMTNYGFRHMLPDASKCAEFESDLSLARNVCYLSYLLVAICQKQHTCCLFMGLGG